MTYNDIVTLVTRRLGWKGLSANLKSDLRLCINMAESELMQDTAHSFATVTLPVSSSQSEYSLSDEFGVENFNQPYEIILYDANGNKLNHIELSYDKWLRWNPSQLNKMPVHELAEIGSRIAVSIHYVGEDAPVDAIKGYMLSVKPSFDGVCILHYSLLPTRDIFDDLSRSPNLPEKLHQFIVAGAVYRQAQVMAGNALANGDINLAQVYQTIESRAYSEYKAGLSLARQSTHDRTKAVVAKPFMWYNDIDSTVGKASGRRRR